MNRPTRTTTRRLAAAAAALAVAGSGALAASGAADAQTRAAGRPIYITTGGTERQQVAIFHGAFTAAGRDDASHDQYDVVRFGNGSLRITHPDSQSTFVPHVNAKTCFATFDLKGKFTLGHGTGHYAHVSGSGTYTGHGTTVLPRTKSGACDMNADPAYGLFVVNGRGTVK